MRCLVAKGSPINSAKDLEGKTVAVNTLNNIVHLMAMAWLDKNGASSGQGEIRRSAVSTDGSRAGGRKDRRRQRRTSPFASAALAKDVARVLANPWSDVLGRFLIASWFASEKWLQKNKQTAQAFISGSQPRRRCHWSRPQRKPRHDRQVDRLESGFGRQDSAAGVRKGGVGKRSASDHRPDAEVQADSPRVQGEGRHQRLGAEGVKSME